MNRVPVLPGVLALLWSLSAHADVLPSSNPVSSAGDQASGWYERGKTSISANQAWSGWRKGDRNALAEIFAQAKNGSTDAQVYAGYLLDNGEGVKADSKSAATYFKAAASNSLLARYNLGVLYQYGRGVEKNEQLAAEYFASAKDVPQANVQLAVFYLKKNDREKAAQWANLAKPYKIPTAYYILGKIEFDKGAYVPAEKLLSEAAAASEPNAPALLSKIYGNGLVGDANPVMGAMWWHIYQRLNGKSSSPTSFSASITSEQAQQAYHHAERWIATHDVQKKFYYSKTIYENNLR